MKRKNGDNKTLRWLIAGAKGKKRYIAILVLLNAIMGALNVLSALLLAGIIDCAAAGDWEGFRLYCGLEIGKVVVQISLSVMLHFLDEYTKAALENGFKQRLFTKLLTGDYAAVTAVHSGEWMTRLTSDTVVAADGRVLGKMAHSERRGDGVALNIYGNQNQLIFEQFDKIPVRHYITPPIIIDTTRIIAETTK